jgi:hypothetical protein
MAALDFPPGPSNGQQYTFNGVNYYFDATVGAWLTSVVGNPIITSTATVSETTPAIANVGDIWFNTSLSKLFVYYNDGDSSQWVEPSYAAVFPGQSQINAAYTVANAAFGNANSTLVVASAAFNAANNVNLAPPFNTANAGYTVANAAFVKANSALQNTTGVFSGTLTITGNVCSTFYCGNVRFTDGTTQTTASTQYTPSSWTTLGGIATGALCCYTVPSGKTSVKVYAVGQGGTSPFGGGGGGFAAGCLSVTAGCNICACFCCGCVVVVYNGNTIMVSCCANGYCAGSACVCSGLFSSCAVAYSGGTGGGYLCNCASCMMCDCCGWGGGGGSAGSPLGNGYQGGTGWNNYSGAGGAGIGGRGANGNNTASGGGGAGGCGNCYGAAGGAGGPASIYAVYTNAPGPSRSLTCMFTDPLLQYATSSGGGFTGVACCMWNNPVAPGPGGGGGATGMNQPQDAGAAGDFGGGGGAHAGGLSNLAYNGGNGGFLGGGGAIGYVICNTQAIGCKAGDGGCGGGGGGAAKNCCTCAAGCYGNGGCPVFMVYG